MKMKIVACSNGLPYGKKAAVDSIVDYFEAQNHTVLVSPYIYGDFDDLSRTAYAKKRAEVLMEGFSDCDMSMIFDVSGGDIANEILPYLDYEVIQNSKAIYVGYSDLTTILNAIYAKTKKGGILYQIRFLLQEENNAQRLSFVKQEFELPEYHFLRGTQMKGTLVGGNIRCFLKLAGTEYFPDCTDKILLLEAMSGDVAKMSTYLAQLAQLGVFDKINGIMLGSFTQMEQEKLSPTIEELVLDRVNSRIPIAKTNRIGHGVDACPVWIGKEYHLSM